MAYTRIDGELADFDRDHPWKKEYVSHMEDGIDDCESQCAELKGSLSELGLKKVEVNNFAAGTTYRVYFGSTSNNFRVVGILYVRGTQAAQYLTLFVNGYGIGSERNIVYEIAKGNSISYEIGEDGFYIDVTPSAAAGGTNNAIGFFSISSNVAPTISTI